jgi:hypothetical protein
MNKLKPGLLKTYLRKRLIMFNLYNKFDLQEYELNKMSAKYKNEYKEKYILYLYNLDSDERGRCEEYDFRKFVFDDLDEDDKIERIERKSNGDSDIPVYMFGWNLFTEEQKLNYLTYYARYASACDNFICRNVGDDGIWFYMMEIDTKVKYLLYLLRRHKDYKKINKLLSDVKHTDIEMNEITLFRINQILKYFNLSFGEYIREFFKNNLILILNKKVYNYYTSKINI